MKIPETGSSENENFSAEENAEGIFITFSIPENTNAYELYIEGIGLVTENYDVRNKTEDDFFYPFLTPDKDYTIRVKFLKEEVEKDGWNFGRPENGIIGYFDVTAKAGSQSKGEVSLIHKGQIDVKKNGEFRFTKKPTFQNEDLLSENGNKWEVEIGLVEGISWEHDAERRTKWHTMQETIPINNIYDPIDLYEDQEKEKTEYSIDFICVRPILNYEYKDKTYKYQWDSFVRDIYYPPIANSDLINGIYVEYPVLPEKSYSRCDVYIDGIGKVAEMKDDSINFLDSSKTYASFFYPFVEPGKKYTVRFSFKRPELKDSEDFTIPTPNETIREDSYTVTVGAKSKGEVLLKSKGKVDAASTKQGNFKFTEKPKFQNEELLGNDWMIELGLMEGISWEHGDERRTKWHCTVQIPKDKLDAETNLYKQGAKESDSIDCICVRPILLNYEYKGKKYSYQWDGFVHDVYYPLRNPDGIYVELDLPKQPFSRCDVTIDGIEKVAEEVKPLEGNPARASFFYPFVEPNKEYTIHFSFKKLEPVDSEGFTLPTPGNDTLSEVKMNVTAGARSKGEVRLPWENVGYLKADPDCNIIHFKKPEFENEHLLGNDWMIEIGLMEGVSWNHGEERRTKWHCAVKILPNDINVTSKNLRDLPLAPGYDGCPTHNEHDIDCICVRPIMYYKYDGKTYKYHWDGYASDVHYPLNADFEEIDINDPADIAKIKGTWTQSGEWDETEHFLAKVHGVYNETLVIDDANVKTSYSYTYTKLNGSAFTKEELADMVDPEPYLAPIPSSEIDAFENELTKDEKILKFEKHLVYYEQEQPYYQYYIYKLDEHNTLSNNGKTLTTKDDSESPLSMRFGDYDYSGDDQQYTRHYQLKLFQDGKQLQVLTYGTDEEGYYEWTDIYQKQ
ncbi:MAG: hypothetical protein K2I95_08935 [Treponemataceae bacterium]|nr:hypothetical protein [Treponemataceae bacterium]